MVIVITRPLRVTCGPLSNSQLSIITFILITTLTPSVCNTKPCTCIGFFTNKLLFSFCNLLICSLVSWFKKLATKRKHFSAKFLRIVKISSDGVSKVAFSKHSKISRFFQWAFNIISNIIYLF